MTSAARVTRLNAPAHSPRLTNATARRSTTMVTTNTRQANYVGRLLTLACTPPLPDGFRRAGGARLCMASDQRCYRTRCGRS